MSRRRSSRRVKDANRRLPQDRSYPSLTAYDAVRQLDFLGLRSRRRALAEFPLAATARRMFVPGRPPSAASRRVTGRSGRAYSPKLFSPQVVLGAQRPSLSKVCERRQTRKEVLHANRKTGSGGPPQKSPVFNVTSFVRCRRGR